MSQPSRPGMMQNRWVRILGVAFVMHILAYIDRNNIAMAIPAMRESLGLSASSIGFSSGALYFTYVIMQIPGGRLAETWSAKKLILTSAILWGAASLSTAFVRTGSELLINRLFMGLVEGAETITLIVLVRNWFTRSERARALTVILISVPLASVVSNLISGVVLERFGWQWMFVIEALPCFLWAVVWQFAICDRPEQASWLPHAERQNLVAELKAEALAAKPLPGHWVRALWHPAVLLLSLNNLFFLTGNLGVVLWLPSVLKESGLSISTVGMLSSLTYLCGAAMMVLLSFTSDRFQERKWHVIGTSMLAGMFLLIVPQPGQSTVFWSVACFTCINGLLYGRFAVFWALPSEILPPQVLGVGLGLINSIGALGGFLGPYLFGYVRSNTSGFSLALTIAACLLLLAGLVTIPIRVDRRSNGAPHHAAPAISNRSP
jgi:MFS family permease